MTVPRCGRGGGRGFIDPRPDQLFQVGRGNAQTLVVRVCGGGGGWFLANAAAYS